MEASPPEVIPPRGDYTRLGALVGAAFAISVAALYAVGAVLRAAELLAADVDVREAVPLVPLEQILTRGMAEVLRGFLSLLVLIPLIGVSAFVVGAVEKAIR